MKIIKKMCPKCKTDAEFGINKARKNGLQVWCRNCLRDYRRSKRQEKSVYNKRYQGLNSDAMKAYRRQWRKENKGHVKRYYSDYFQTPNGRAAKLIAGIRNRCKYNGMPCTIASNNLIPILSKGICQTTGIPLDFETIAGPFSPSVDRIDHQRGYEPNNIQIVVLIYNLAKRNWTHEDVLELAKALACS